MNNLMGFLSIEAYTPPFKRGEAAGVQFAVIAKPGTGATPAKSEPGSGFAGVPFWQAKHWLLFSRTKRSRPQSLLHRAPAKAVGSCVARTLTRSPAFNRDVSLVMGIELINARSVFWRNPRQRSA